MRSPLAEARQGYEDARGREAVIEAVEVNARLLQGVIAEIESLRADIVPARQDHQQEELKRRQDESVRLKQRVRALENELSDVRQQNENLASKLANQCVHDAVADTPADESESLSWEERKQLIIQQMDEEAFGCDSQATIQAVNPSSLDQLNHSIHRLQSEVESRDKEIMELRGLLEHQSQTKDGCVAIGAAAIAQLVDDDELIQQERQRLQHLQTEWEEKFRQGEIEASLERAKLSRERQEVARQKMELAEQLERLQREMQRSEEGVGTRRWLAKLGLSEDDS